MKRILLVMLFTFNILSSNENAVKTSELELFLFKVGFESLLKDVEISKDKTKLNEDEIGKINEKIELIMSELYKKNQVLLDDSKEEKTVKIVEKVDNKELENLKFEIALLKKEIDLLKKTKPKKIKQTSKKLMKVNSKSAYIYSKANQNSKILRIVKNGSLVSIKSCDKYGWCKLSEKNEYIKKYLLK